MKIIIELDEMLESKIDKLHRYDSEIESFKKKAVEGDLTQDSAEKILEELNVSREHVLTMLRSHLGSIAVKALDV
ncbi:hypothetical protein NF212_20310 [Parasalinivibrio latis]|uniref:hypothetical protein n=1 Tax=Parasalinivibrio latis TaxID=2952610 RepID=UPI0030DE4A65